MHLMRLAAAALVLLAWSQSASDASACAAVGHAGAYVRLAKERTLVVWDADLGVEHFVRTPVFDGDPSDFGFLVPTPVVPAVGKVNAAVFDALERRLPYAPDGSGAARATTGPVAAAPAPVTVEQRVQIDDFELVTLRAGGGDTGALVEWLKKHDFASRPSLAMWAEKYVRKGWVLNAMRYAPQIAAPAGRVETPTVRLSFAIAAPFYPYTESPPDPATEETYLERTRAPLAPRRLDLWIVAPSRLEMHGKGPAVVAAADRVAGPELATILGDTKDWKLDPTSRSWTMVRYFEQSSTRTAFEDLTWAPPSSGADGSGDAPPADRSRRFAMAIAAVAIALALGVAFLTDRSSPEG
jgi:hypothetical protein